MAIDDMIAQIDAEIEALETRIRKLRDAKETIESLHGSVASGGYHEFPTTSEQSASRTREEDRQQESRRATPARRGSTGQSFVASLMDRPQSVKDQVLTVVREADKPLTSAEIREAIGLVERKQTIWAAISDLAHKGILTKNEAGEYSLAS